jgi:hypothetical protein
VGTLQDLIERRARALAWWEALGEVGRVEVREEFLVWPKDTGRQESLIMDLYQVEVDYWGGPDTDYHT